MGEKKTLKKRDNFRAVLSASVKVTPVDSQDIKLLQHSGKKTKKHKHSYTGSRRTDDVIVSIMDYIIHIDEKLDYIINRLDGKPEEESRKSLDVNKMIDISGSGINITLNEEVEVGQFLKMVIRLPEFPSGTFEVLGEVVRREKRQNENGSDSWHLGVRFLDMSEEQREILIRYTFSQHRKQIRSSFDKEPEDSYQQADN